MFPSSSSHGMQGSLSPQKAGDNDIPFENLVKAAQEGRIERVVAAITALEATAPASFENHHLIQYIANLQDNNQIFTATLCWLALLAKSIAAAKNNLSILGKGLDAAKRDALEKEKKIYQDDLVGCPGEIQAAETEIAALDAQNAEEIRKLQAEFEPIEKRLNTTCSKEDILNCEKILDWEKRYQSRVEELQNIGSQQDYTRDRFPQWVNDLHCEVLGKKGNTTKIDNADRDLESIKTHLGQLRSEKEEILTLVDRRNTLFEQLTILRNVDGKTALGRLKHRQEQTLAEISKIDQLLNRQNIAAELEPVIKRGDSTDDDLVKKSLSIVTTTNPHLLDIAIALNAMTEHRFTEMRKANHSKNFANDGGSQELMPEEQKIIYHSMRLFLSPQNTQELMRQPLNRDDYYLGNLKTAYAGYISTHQENGIITATLQQAWESIKSCVAQLNKCSAVNSLQRFLSPNSLPRHVSVPLIKDMMWDSTEADRSNLETLQQEEQQGCVVAKIYLAERKQRLSFENLTVKGQELQSENPAEAFSCFLAVLENNDAAAYRLAEILEAQSTTQPLTIAPDETRTYLMTRAIVAKNDAAAEYFWQRARAQGSSYAALRTPQANIAAQGNLYAQQNNTNAAMACWSAAARNDDEAATELLLQHQNLSIRQLLILAEQFFNTNNKQSARACFKRALGFGSYEAAIKLRDQYEWKLAEFKQQLGFLELQNNEYSLLGQYACYRILSNGLGDKTSVEPRDLTREKLRTEMYTIALSENFKEKFIWFENYVADDSLCGKPNAIADLELKQQAPGFVLADNFKITDPQQKAFARFYWLKKLLGQLQHSSETHHQNDFDAIALYLTKCLDWSGEDFFSHGRILEDKGYRYDAAFFLEKAKFLECTSARSASYFDYINNSPEGFQNYKKTPGNPDARPLLTAAIERGYTAAVFAFKEKYNLDSGGAITYAAKSKVAKNSKAVALYLLAAAAEKNLGSDAHSISSTATSASTATTATIAAAKVAAGVKKDLITAFETYYEQWNIITEYKKNRIPAVIAALSQYNHAQYVQGNTSNLITVREKLEILAEEGSVTAALYWALLAKLFKNSSQVDLYKKGMELQKKQNLTAAAACWLAALEQGDSAAAYPLALLFNQRYTNCWFDKPLQAQYRTEVLTQSLIQHFCHKNFEKAEQYCRIAIENNSLAAAFFWRLLTQQAPDKLALLGLQYKTANNIAAAITCYRAAMKLNPTNNEPKRQLQEIFEIYDSENPFKNVSCSQLTVLALVPPPPEDKKTPLEIAQDKKEKLTVAMQQGSVAGAFYLAKMKQQTPTDLAKTGLTKYSSQDNNLAAAGACWLAAIEQGDIFAAHYLAYQIIEMNPSIEPTDLLLTFIEKGTERQQQNRLLAASAYFGGASRHGFPTAAYELANLLRNLYEQWQTAIHQGDTLQAAILDATYARIMAIRSDSDHQLHSTPLSSTGQQLHSTSVIDIRYAKQPIAELYKLAQVASSSATNDAMFGNLVDFYATEKDAAGLEYCAAKIQNSQMRLTVATRHEQNQWAPGANTLALKHLKKLARSNFLPAIFKLVQVHMLGELGLPFNYVIASEYACQINNLNNPEAWYQLGLAFDTGQYGLPYSAKVADIFYKKAGFGLSKASEVLFKKYESEAEIEALKTNIRNPHTLYILAQQHEKGNERYGFTKNETLALNYYLLAALACTPPHPGACARLETICQDGLLGVSQNTKEAKRYTRKKTEGLKNDRYSKELPIASAAGNAEAAYQIALLCENGAPPPGLTQKNALEHYRKAAELGHPVALKQLIDKKDAHAAQYQAQLSKITDPDGLYLLGYHNSTAPEANNKNFELANIYYNCAAALGQANAQNELRKNSRLPDETKALQKKFKLHPQNLLKLAHVYELVLEDKSTAFKCYEIVLKTDIAEAAKQWGPITGNDSSLYTDESNSDELHAIYGAVYSRLAHAYEFGEFGISENQQTALQYYKIAADHHDIDAYLRLALASTRGDFGNAPNAREGISNYSMAFRQFPRTRYRSSHAYFLFGLALTEPEFDLYRQEGVYAFLESMIKEANIDTLGLFSALAQQNARALNVVGGFNESIAVPESAPDTDSDVYYSFYTTVENKKIAALLFKIAAEMNNINAILELDSFNHSQYLPSYLETPNELLDYYQQFQRHSAPVMLRLGRIFDPYLRPSTSNHRGFNGTQTPTEEMMFNASLPAEARRYYKWITYLGLNLQPVRYFSNNASNIQPNPRTAIGYYSCAADTDRSCLEARALLAAAFLYGAYGSEQDLTSGRRCYDEVIRLYQSAPLNVIQTHFGLISKTDINIQYHESSLAKNDGWQKICTTYLHLLVDQAEPAPESLSAEELFTLAQYYTLAPTVQETEQAPLVLTSPPSLLARVRSSTMVFNSSTPYSDSPQMRRASVAMYASPVTPDSIFRAPPQNSALLTLEPLSPPPPRSVSRLASVADPTSLLDRSSGTATPTSSVSLASSHYSTAPRSGPIPLSRGSTLTNSSAVPSQRRGSVSSTHSLEASAVQDPWQRLLIDLSHKQKEQPGESVIDHFQQHQAVKTMWMQQPTCYFPAWQTPPNDAAENALKYYQLAAIKKYPPALIMLTKIYFFGLMGQSVEIERAKTFYAEVYSAWLNRSMPVRPTPIRLGDNILASPSHPSLPESSNETDGLFSFARVLLQSRLNQSGNKDGAIQLYRQALSTAQIIKPQKGLHLFLCALAYSEGLLGCSPNQQLAVNYCQLAKNQGCIEALPVLLSLENLNLLPKTKDFLPMPTPPMTPLKSHMLPSSQEKLLYQADHFLAYCALGDRYYPQAIKFNSTEESWYLSTIYYLCSIGEAALPKQEKTRVEILIDEYKTSVFTHSINPTDLWKYSRFLSSVITTYITTINTTELAPIPEVLQPAVTKLCDFISSPRWLSSRSSELKKQLAKISDKLKKQIRYVRLFEYYFGIPPTP